MLVKHQPGQPFTKCWVFHCEKNQTSFHVSWSLEMSEEDRHESPNHINKSEIVTWYTDKIK